MVEHPKEYPYAGDYIFVDDLYEIIVKYEKLMEE
jgi:hypothetical protein